VEAFRKSLKAETEKQGVRVTLLSFFMKACAATLKAYPTFNSSLDGSGENLILKKYINIGVAVDTPNGLVVPVIRDVDRKSIFEISAELMEMSAKARDKKLKPGDMQGATFTISSLGGIGGTAFTPIVNAPEVAILGLTRSQMKPVWNGSEFIPRLMQPMSLSYDHRVIDGAQAAHFVRHLGVLMNDVRRLLL
jgi:pyruvate dehydrogenase E2 component (dihydrolipoamide acetyltransferase)